MDLKFVIKTEDTDHFHNYWFFFHSKILISFPCNKNTKKKQTFELHWLKKALKDLKKKKINKNSMQINNRVHEFMSIYWIIWWYFYREVKHR